MNVRYHRHTRLTLAVCVLLGVAACAPEPQSPSLFGTVPVGDDPAASQPYPVTLVPGGAVRTNGIVGSLNSAPAALVSMAPQTSLRVDGTVVPVAGGDISLDFADTDIREVVAQILGTILKVNYTIDPSIRGTASLRTVIPLARSQLIPTLQTLLSQSGAGLIQTGGLYRVLPIAAAAAAAASGLAGDATSGGSAVVPLRFASAEDLAKVLQPFVANGGKITADPGRNALLVSGDPATRQTLLTLIAAFDIDILSGQSYALFPVTAGDAKDFASALQDAFRGQGGGSLAGVVKVVPMQRINAVLVVTSQPRYIEDVRRVYGLVERTRRMNIRVWHVFYLQNSRANDIAYVLQQAFTPSRVTAQPNPTGTAASRSSRQSTGGGGTGGGTGGGSLGGRSGIGGALRANSSQDSLAAPGNPASDPAASGGGAGQAQGSANPLLGGLEPGDTGGDSDTMRIIPNQQNNALLIYGTGQEQDTVLATLRKLDILPLQVRIDATIAEVTLNDTLKYGTQFFFRGGGLAGALGGTLSATPATAISSAASGFVFGSSDGQSALSALQAVTNVKVLSSPQLLVLDNESARLQVGNIVPFLTQSSQSTLTSGSPVINSIDYRETGVIMEVTPRVNGGGLVTLDISQEVSAVDPAGPTTSGINSPTFQERSVRSRVVVQDGQTVGLAGLIQDSDSRGNSGIPWLKDVPILGLLAGKQSNQRTRTELLVLITPHVVHDQRDARSLTEDLRDTLTNAALVPSQLQSLRPSGSADPSARLRRRLGLQP